MEVSPRCLLWACNSVFHVEAKGEKKKEENGLVSSEPSLSRRKRHSAQDDTRSKVKNKSSRLRWLSHLAGSSWATCKKMFCLQTLGSNQASSCSDRRLTDRPLYEDHGTSVAKFDSPPQLSPLGVVSFWGRSLQKPWPWSQCGDNPSRSAAVCETLRRAARPLATATPTTTKVTQIADIFCPIIIKMNMKTGWS